MKRITSRERRDQLGLIKRAMRKAAVQFGKGERSQLLSVIIPVYNVEQYIADCLKSVLGQSYRSLEVIVVDDGSPDESFLIARSFALQDKRVRIVRQKNGGLGAARNTGLRYATGRYLAFVDSDDTVPKGAFHRLVGSLESSGSDIAVGALERLRGGRRIKPAWARIVHGRELIGIRLEDFPQILRNFYTPGKVYRRSLWTMNKLTFREGVLFEDQPVVTEAYAAARAIDVLDAVTYTWLARTDGSSLSQSMFTFPHVLAREEATHLTAAVMSELNNSEITDAWFWTLLEYHLPAYLGRADTMDDTTYQAIVDMVASIFGRSGPPPVENVAAENRILVYLAMNTAKSDVEEFLLAGGRNIRNYRTIFLNDRPVAELASTPALMDIVPEPVREMRVEEMKPAVTLRSVEWIAESRLRLRGWAYILGLPADLCSGDTSIVLTNKRTEERVAFEANNTVMAEATLEAGHKWLSYDHSGFSVDVDLATLGIPSEAGSGELAEWSVHLAMTVLGAEHESTFTKSFRDSLNTEVNSSLISEGIYAQLRWRWPSGLSVRLVRRAIGLSSIRASTGKVELELRRDYGKFEPATVVFVHEMGSTQEQALTRGGANTWWATFRSTQITRETGSWKVYVLNEHGERRNVHVAAQSLAALMSGEASLTAVVDANNRLALRAQLQSGASPNVDHLAGDV